jgi:hypothetical protein
MPRNSYQIDAPLNVIRGQRHVVLPVGKYETEDPEIIRIIHSYPNVRFLGSTPRAPVTGAGGAATDEAAPLPATEPAVKIAPGLQLREKRTGCSTGVGLSTRIAERDTDQ